MQRATMRLDLISEETPGGRRKEIRDGGVLTWGVRFILMGMGRLDLDRVVTRLLMTASQFHSAIRSHGLLDKLFRSNLQILGSLG